MLIPKQDCFSKTWCWTQKFVQTFLRRCKLYCMYFWGVIIVCAFWCEASLHFLCFCLGTRLFVNLIWRESDFFPIHNGLLKKSIVHVQAFQDWAGLLACQILIKPLGKRTRGTLFVFQKKLKSGKKYLMDHLLILPDWQCAYEHLCLYILFSYTFFPTVVTGKSASN